MFFFIFCVIKKITKKFISIKLMKYFALQLLYESKSGKIDLKKKRMKIKS